MSIIKISKTEKKLAPTNTKIIVFKGLEIAKENNELIKNQIKILGRLKNNRN